MILISKKRGKVQFTPITADATEVTENAPITVSELHLRTTPCDFMKIMIMRKAASNTEHPAIRQISVLSPALLVVVLFIYWVVWIIMKWIV